MRLGMSSEDLQDQLQHRLILMKNMNSSQGAGKANPKLGAKTPLRIKLGDKTSLFPFFFPDTISILTSYFSPSLAETRAQHPSAGVMNNSNIVNVSS